MPETTQQALKRIEEKHCGGFEGYHCERCGGALPCVVVKLARALDHIAKTTDDAAAREDARRTLEEVASE